jgi:hypothetical protein
LMNIVAILSAKKLGFLLAFANDVSSFFFTWEDWPMVAIRWSRGTPSTIGCITLGDMYVHVRKIGKNPERINKCYSLNYGIYSWYL